MGISEGILREIYRVDVPPDHLSRYLLPTVFPHRRNNNTYPIYMGSFLWYIIWSNRR